MKNLLLAWLAGLLFALGLGVSGMTKPSKVIGFLAITPNWDPTLLFVMGGAVLVYAIGYRFIRRRPTPILAHEFHIPLGHPITKRLVLGSTIFGVGWGLGGYCPGPAVVAVTNGGMQTLLFCLTMLGGFLLQGFLSRIFALQGTLSKIPTNEKAKES